MSGTLERRLAESLRAPEPIGGACAGSPGRSQGPQLGLAVGYVAPQGARPIRRRADRAARPPRLLFVAPNLAVAHRAARSSRGSCSCIGSRLHELTHAFQFASVPWLRGYLGGFVDELLEQTALATDLSELAPALRRLLQTPGPDRVVEQLREGGASCGSLAGPGAGCADRAPPGRDGRDRGVLRARDGRDRRRARRRLRAAARGGRCRARAPRRSGIDRRDAARPGDEASPVRLGKRFADTVVERAGIDGLNAVWRSPAALPGRDEIERPERWLAAPRRSERAPRAWSCNRAARVE